MVYALVQALIILIVSESYLVEAAKDYIPPKIIFPNSSDNELYFKGGKTAVITCLADGNPKPTWLENDIEIKRSHDLSYNENSGVLEIARFSTKQETAYRCIATNQYGQVSVSTMSPELHLWQMRLEKFSSRDEEIHDVTEYQYLKLPCGDRKASKVPKLNTAWYSANKLDTLSLGAGRLYVDQDGSLHFTYVLLGDNHHSGYVCGISTNLADDMNYIQLGTKHVVRVKKASFDPSTGVRIHFEYSNTVVMAMKNSTAMLECLYSGYGLSLIPIQWWANAIHEPYLNSSKMNISKDGRQLFIHNVQEEDEMFYYCKAKASTSEETTAVFMNVTSGPVFINGPPKDQIGFVDSKVEFNCEARSVKGENPPSPVLWFVNSKAVNQDYDKNKFEFTYDNKVLIVKKLRNPQDVMCVQCLVENDIDAVLATACLDVLVPITIKQSPKRTQEIKYGDKIDLTVIVTTDETLPVKYAWSMPNRKFDEKDVPHFMSWDPIKKTAIIDTKKMSTTDYESMKAGQYKITVSNQYQNVSVDVEVKFVDEKVVKKKKKDPEEPEKDDKSLWLLIVLLLLALMTCFTMFIICLAIKKGQRTTRAKSNVQEEQEGQRISLSIKRSGVSDGQGTISTEAETEV